jgi:hypothetical protein
MANGNEERDHPNVFYPVAEGEIVDAESRLGVRLPEQLRTFYHEVGYGFFKSARPLTERSGFTYINRFLAPSQVADLLTGQDEEVSPSEGFDEGELPFFEVGDRLYLVIRPSTRHPNQVCWPYGDQISEDLIEFTKRLAVNPRFYHNV